MLQFSGGRSASSKTYVYYHCANQQCRERRINTSQDKLFQQIVATFEPFSKFTAGAVREFTKCMHGRLHELDLYMQKQVGDLANKRLQLKEGIEKLELLRQREVLAEDVYQHLLKAKREALEQVKIEIDAHNEADLQTYNQGIKVIELLVNACNFMGNPEKNLERVRLAKLVLSNPKLRGGTIEYDYEKPFDVLPDLMGTPAEWRRGRLVRKLLSTEPAW